MAASTRPGAYIWATWIAPLLGGTSLCTWSVWFRAHHYFRKRTTFDDPTWQTRHSAMVNRAVDDFRADGFNVTVEDENAFVLTSHGISLAGRPDLIAVRPDRVIVIDCKSGLRRPAHRFQLLTYMVVLPCVRPNLRQSPVEGLLLYTDEVVSIPAHEADEAFRLALRDVIHLVGAHTPPSRAPSAGECRFCPISTDDCSERIDLPEAVTVNDHGLF
jgi:CRISPR/Cas system-associated exonuclease Cas4 (RecB family)